MPPRRGLRLVEGLIVVAIVAYLTLQLRPLILLVISEG